MVHIERIKRQFGPRVLFEELSWMIPRGARVGLVGPNGAGKTTLLRILAGLDAPDAGRINQPSAMRVGYLPQEVETVADGSVLAVVLDGFGELRRIEEELEDLERRMSGLRPSDPELVPVSAAYGELRHRFEAIGGDRVESRARAILSGLGVPEASFHQPLGHLSGGWRMRVVLARLLLATPDLLLLDEPTNHLDLEAIAWLEGFLETYDGAFIVVSHDRYFLNRMVKGIVELERGRLQVFPGGYDDYLGEREARETALEQAAKQQARELAQIERFIERFRYKATKARQVQSRLHALEKVERIEAPSRAKRIRFDFPAAPRSGDVVCRVEGLFKAYGDNVVYRDASLLLRRSDRVALVGPNGAGKSTLLKLLAGSIDPDGGTVELGHTVTVHYYAQHQLEALDPRRTVLEEIERVADPGMVPRLRTLLGCFLFSGDDVDKRVGVLSGGEKARLALAKLLIRPANLLLLDEPTNHLDLRSREVLEDALDEYDGTLVVISHDRYFINRVATAIAEVGEGRIELYPGDYDTYHEHRERREAEIAAAEAASPADAARTRQRVREMKRAEAEERNRRYRERRAVEIKLEPVEAEIATLEARVRELSAMQADPVVYRDAQRARDIGREKTESEGRLRTLYARWEALAAELESAGS
jgi:ATP-binding cassette subfamily F protein 3